MRYDEKPGRTGEDAIREAVFRRLLIESVLPDHLAAVVRKSTGKGKSRAAIYDRRVIASAAGEDEMFWAVRECPRGYAEVSRPSQPCSGAWKVDATWGPGIGRIVYSVAFALTPDGILMPDRVVVSGPAGESWRKALGRGIVPINLDDERHRECRANGTHTSNPDDDCPIHGEREKDRPWLDKAYSAGPMTGEYAGILETLSRRNAELRLDEEVEDSILEWSYNAAEEAIGKSLGV